MSREASDLPDVARSWRSKLADPEGAAAAGLLAELDSLGAVELFVEQAGALTRGGKIHSKAHHSMIIIP
jgi:hypothetical protein